MKPDTAGRLPTFLPELRAKVRTGEKTMTRRVIKPQPANLMMTTSGELVPMDSDNHVIKCPLGKPGEVRYLREPLLNADDYAAYKDDDPLYSDGYDFSGTYFTDASGENISWRWKVNTLSSMFMPREAARTFVRLTEIRAERLQEITEEDIRREGVTPASEGDNFMDAWIRLWNSINGTRDGGKYAFDMNPMVWVQGWELLA